MRISLDADLLDSCGGRVVLDLPNVKTVALEIDAARMVDPETGIRRPLDETEEMDLERALEGFRAAVMGRVIAKLIRIE